MKNTQKINDTDLYFENAQAIFLALFQLKPCKALIQSTVHNEYFTSKYNSAFNPHQLDLYI